MSHQAVEWALDIQGLRPPIKLVLVALAERADAKGGSCHPGITELTRRASNSRRRVVDAIRELEAIGALQVRRSTSSDGKRRSVNHYDLAVGQTIIVPKKAVQPAAKKGTRVVPQGNQVGSPGYTVTFLEPPLNRHSDTYVSAAFPKKARDDDLAEAWDGEMQRLPDESMIAAAQASGIDPEHLGDIIADYRGDLLDKAEAGNSAAQKQYRTLWFAVLNGKAPDLEDKL